MRAARPWVSPAPTRTATPAEGSHVVQGHAVLIQPVNGGSGALYQGLDQLRVVDALAARRLSRLGTTVQLSDTGIIPGSGVGNARKEITERSVGIPVISVGIPTVVDVGTLVNDLTGSKSDIPQANRNMIITPREIDIVIERASELIGMTINKALQPDISVDEMMMIVGN